MHAGEQAAHPDIAAAPARLGWGRGGEICWSHCTVISFGDWIIQGSLVVLGAHLSGRPSTMYVVGN